MATDVEREPTDVQTYVVEGAVSQDEMIDRVLATRREHDAVLQAFHRVWYDAGPHTWGYTHFLGVGTMKCPLDLWMYQDLIARHRPRTIIETGTYAGGSALWYAYLMEMLGIEGGHVYTVDNEDHRKCDHPRITFLGGDSTNPRLVEALAEHIERPLMVILDSDHGQAHVYRELCLYAPLVQVDEWLVVEDTNISWPGDGGARAGAEKYMKAHEGEFAQRIMCERYLLTFSPGGWLQRVAKCAHGEPA